MSIVPRALVRRQGWLAVAAALLVLVAVAAPAAAVSGPTRLLDPSVTPTTGGPSTPVRLEVTYRNREGSAPDHVHAVIDGTPRAMSAEGGSTDWKAGVRYGLTTTLTAGTHTISFEAADTRRFSDSIPGATVTIQAPAATPAPAPTPKPEPTPAPTQKPQPAPAPTPKPEPTPAPTARPESPATPAPVTGAAGSGDSADPTAAPGGPGALDPTGAGWSGEPESPGTEGSAILVPGTLGGTRGEDVGGSAAPSGAGPARAEAGPADEAALLDSEPAWVRILPTFVATAAGVSLAMAFLLFGKRRRDGEQPDSDEALAASAATGSQLAAASLVPAGPAGAAGAQVPSPIDIESDMPRWRRPSLLQARKADPLRTVSTNVRLTFDRGAVSPAAGLERRLVRYRLVRLLDAPDEVRSTELGTLDEGDEVQLVERSGSFWFVLCPDGRQGWVHRMTLGDIVEPARPEQPGPAADDEAAVEDADILTAYLQARAARGA